MSVEGTLRATLEERADALPQVRPDVAGLMAGGERARAARRRNRLVVVAAAATVVAIVVVSFRFADRDGEPRPIETPDRVPERTLVDTTVVDHVGSPDSSRAVVIDPAAQRVYVGQNAEGRRAGGVAVVDATSQTLVDTVEIGSPSGTGPPSLGGLALDASRQLLYVSNANREHSQVVVISTASNEVIDTIDVRVDTASPDHAAAVAFDPATDSLFLAYASQPKRVRDREGNVVVVDTRTRSVTATIPVDPDPLGMALDTTRKSVFVTGSSGEMQVIDTGSRTIVDTIEGVGWGPTAADPASGLVLQCNEGDGTVTIVDADTHEVLETLRVGGLGPFGVAVHSQARLAYVDDKVIDLETLEVTGWLRSQLPGRYLETVAVHPDDHTAYASLRRIGNPVFVAFTPPTL